MKHDILIDALKQIKIDFVVLKNLYWNQSAVVKVEDMKTNTGC